MRAINIGFGIFLLFAGIILMLNTGEVLPWSVWLYLVQFWPFLLIILGIGVVLNEKGVGFVGALAIFLVVYTLGISLFFHSWQNNYFNIENYSQKSTDNRISEFSRQYSGQIERVNLEIVSGSSRIKAESLPKDSDNLYEGRHESNFANLSREADFAGKKAKIKIESAPFLKKFFESKSINNLNLKLNPSPEYDILLKSGASNIDFDLSNLNVSKLNIEGGASKIEISLNGEKDIEAEVKTAASSIKIEAPKELGLKLANDSSLASDDFKNTNGLVKTDEGWETKGFKKASKKAIITFKSSISDIELERN